MASSLLRTLSSLTPVGRTPRVRGRLHVQGLQGRVHIARDANGVPHIDATCETDAFFGLGFCHAQDRAFQLELLVRVVQGRLAEALGKDALALDRLSRRVGFQRAGERQLAFCDPAIQHQLRAYCRGIRAALRGREAPAPELRLLGVPATEWEPADVLGLLALLCFALSSNWDMELARLRILLADGPDALRALDPGGREADLQLPRDVDASPLEALERELARLRAHVAFAGGSNAWAVAGERTASGAPLLANDPHLDPAFPCAWYLAHLRAPGMHVAGATFVGVPAVGAGHNGFAAWGLTAAHVDNTDLFLERISPDGRSVMGRTGWERCPVVHERILVRGGEPVEESILQTERGPIFERLDTGDGPIGLSIAATFLAARGYRGFLAIHHVRSFDDLRETFREGTSSAAGIVYADREGTIGRLLAAEVPGRDEGVGILPGWGADVGGRWHAETTPANETSHVVRPADGVVVCANQRPAELRHRLHVGVDFLDDWRHDTIERRLLAHDAWTLHETAALQLDTHTPLWDAVRGVFLEACDAAPPGPARDSAPLLAAWDGSCDADSAAATLFHFALASLADQLVDTHARRARGVARGDGLSPLVATGTMMLRRPGHVVRLLLQGEAEPWGVSRNEAVQLALAVARSRIEAQAGREGAAWAWGRVRPLRLRHVLDRVPAVGRLFRLPPVPIGGGTHTVAQAAVDLRDPSAPPIGVATLRMRVDTGDWEASRWALIHGQSGNPFSEHHADQVGVWQTNEGVPIPFHADAVARATVATLTLEPARARPRKARS